MITKPTDAGMQLLEQVGLSGDGTSAQGCMQCGMCAASCPLGEAMEFPPSPFRWPSASSVSPLLFPTAPCRP